MYVEFPDSLADKNLKMHNILPSTIGILISNKYMYTLTKISNSYLTIENKRNNGNFALIKHFAIGTFQQLQGQQLHNR